MEGGNSKAFLPYRGLGLVTNNVPLAVSYVQGRKQCLITTSVGHAFHTYEDKHLRLIHVGNPHTSSITCLARVKSSIFSANGKTISGFSNGSDCFFKYEHDGNVHAMLPLGPFILSVDDKNVFRVLKMENSKLDLQMEFPSTFKITCFFHPPTIIDTVMMGSEQGKIQLWNIKRQKLIKTITGWDSQVLVLEDTRTIDHVAIGLNDGSILVYNWQKDIVVRRFKQECGPVISLSFRKDNIQILISGSTSGNIAVWDVDNNKLSSQIKGAHEDAVTSIECMEDEPLMVTSSPDNAIKMWIFDQTDGGARKLSSRLGYSAPPIMARFHGSLGDKILTSGEDSTVRIFSTITDVLNKNLGMAAYNRKPGKSVKIDSLRKMSPINKFSSEAEQNKSWDNIACIHRNSPIVTTWSVKHQCMGKHKLLHERFKKQFKNVSATAVDITVCGNFIFVGFDSGHIDKFNIQSGIYRGSLGEEVAHEDTVSDIKCDGLNQCIITADLRGNLKWWEFKTHVELDNMVFEDGLSILKLHRDSGLLAVASEGMTIYIIDINTRVIARKFNGHSNQITDVSFSSDSKWVVSSSLDCTIRTWDIPSGSCVDSFRVPVPATSLDMSPNREFLATVHSGELGIYLWVVRNSFAPVSLYPLPDDFQPPMVILPSAGSDEFEDDDESEDITKTSESEEMIMEEYVTPDQISDKFITLSLQPKSRWLNLMNIDTIKKRDRPNNEAQQAPKAAPFFIPTVPGLEIQFAKTQNKDENSTSGSKIINVSSFENLSPFGEFLKMKNYEEAFKCLCSKGPSSIDFEIKGLDPDLGGSQEVINGFLLMIKYALSQKKFFEVAEGFLGLFLKIHFDFIVDHVETQEICQKLLNAHRNSWPSTRESMNQSLCIISYLKNATLINC